MGRTFGPVAALLTLMIVSGIIFEIVKGSQSTALVNAVVSPFFTTLQEPYTAALK